LFDSVDWDIFRPVYKKYTSSKGIQWIHKFCIKNYPQVREYTKEIISMTNDVPHAGIALKMMIIYFNVFKEEA
jgi:hypothetical protein